MITVDEMVESGECPCEVCSSQDDEKKLKDREKYKGLSDSDLKTFKEAIFKDYGIELKGDTAYQAAFNLLQFFEALIKFDQEDKNRRGSKTVQDNPLYTGIDKHKIK